MSRSHPWRFECPKGHRDIRSRRVGKPDSWGDSRPYYCKTCARRYSAIHITDLLREGQTA